MFNFINSIRFRLWLLLIGFTAIILVFLYINQIVMLPNFYNYIKTQETTGVANIIKQNWNNPDLSDEVSRLSREHGMRIYIDTNPDGSDSLKKEVADSRSGVLTHVIILEERETLRYITFVGTTGDIRGYITIYTFLQPLGNTQDVLRSQFFLVSCVVLLVAFALSAFMVMNISSPLIKISRSANKLVTGEFYMKPRKGDYAEINTLTENLNLTSKEIAKTENLRKDLLANVSHDLKTPLTMIKAYAEMIRDLSGDNPEKRENHIKVIIDEADRLNGLVSEMLDLSKLQSGVASKELTLFNFSEHLSDVLGRFDYLSGEHGIIIIPEIEENINVKADLTKIEQVVYNLISNAVNHAGSDQKVFISLFKKKDNIGRFEVRDNGSGISKEELPYIWERYYKAEKSQFHKRTAVGTGLGLSIVKGVMEMHGYAYGVISTPGKGSTFWFEFLYE